MFHCHVDFIVVLEDKQSAKLSPFLRWNLFFSWLFLRFLSLVSCSFKIMYLDVDFFLSGLRLIWVLEYLLSSINNFWKILCQNLKKYWLCFPHHFLELQKLYVRASHCALCTSLFMYIIFFSLYTSFWIFFQSIFQFTGSLR